MLDMARGTCKTWQKRTDYLTCAHKNIGCVNGQKHNSEFLPWLAGGFWITQITQECITRGWIPLEWVTFYMRSDCKTQNCIHHDTSSYQKVGVKFSATQAVHALHVQSDFCHMTLWTPKNEALLARTFYVSFSLKLLEFYARLFRNNNQQQMFTFWDLAIFDVLSYFYDWLYRWLPYFV